MKSRFFRRLTAEILACGMIFTSGSIMMPAAAYAGESETVLVGVGADGTAEPAASESTETAQTQAASETAAPATEAQTAAPATEQQTAAPATEAATSESTATEAPASTTTESGSTATEAPVSEAGTEAKATEATEPATTETASEKDTEESEAGKVNTLKTTSGDATITIASSNGFTEGTTVSATKIDPNSNQYASYLDTAKEIVETDTVEVSYADFFDITIKNKDGNEIQPDTAVKVSITYPNTVTMNADSVDMIHIHDNGSTETVDCKANAADVPITDGTDNLTVLSSVTFDANSFSIYAVIGADNPARRTYVFHNADSSEYQFVDEAGNKTSQQIIKTGDSLQNPGIPSGEGEFDGWYTKPTGGVEVVIGTPITFTESQADPINLYAHFNSKVTVNYHDENGVVFTSKKVEKTETVIPDVDYTSKQGEGYTCIGWSTSQNAETPDAALTITGSVVDLYPVVKQAHWITFDSVGADTNVAPVYVLSNENVPTPLNVPTKNGYTFQGWYNGDTQYTDANGNVVKGGNLTTDIQLTAHWVGAEVSYTIVRWLQDADDDDYKVASDEGVVTVKGNAGESTNVTGKEKTYSGFEFSKVENVTINGDGTSVVNVYYNRVICTIKFYNASAISSGGYSRITNVSNIEDGKVYYHRYLSLSGYKYEEITAEQARNYLNSWNRNDRRSVYELKAANDGEITDLKITARYGADIRDQWPNKKGYPSNWRTSRYGDTYQSGVSTMPLGDDENHLTIFWMSDDDGSYTMNTNYFLESVNGSYGEKPDHTDTFTSDNYSWTTTQEDYYAINGFTVDMNNPNTTQVGGEFEQVGYSDTYEANIYYTRNEYSITFTNGVGSSVLSQNIVKSGIKYEQGIENEASDISVNVPEGYTFAGWFTDPYGKYKYDFVGKTMPAGNLVLYGVYKPIQHTLTFDPAGGILTPSDTSISVEHNTAIPSEKRPSVTKGTDVFLGWYVQNSDGTVSSTPFNFSTHITTDTTLVAKWHSSDDAHYTIAYDAGAGSNAPIDGNSYIKDTDIAVGKGATAPAKNVFVGWKIKKADGSLSDTVYTPGETYKVSSSDANSSNVITFVAQYDVVKVTSITWDPNGGTPKATTDSTALNADIDVRPSTTFTRDGYEFIGWSTTSDNNPTLAYDPATGKWSKNGSEVTNPTVFADLPDANNANSNTIYACWRKLCSLTIKKVIDGNYVDPNGKFKFSVTTTKPGKSAETKEYDITGGSDGVTISNLPVGTKYTIKEIVGDTDPSQYYMKYGIGSEDSYSGIVSNYTVPEQTLNADTTVFIKNVSKIVPTGVDINRNAIVVAVLLISLMGAAYVILASKRSRERG